VCATSGASFFSEGINHGWTRINTDAPEGKGGKELEPRMHANGRETDFFETGDRRGSRVLDFLSAESRSAR
jgi:hypothetical protein